MANIDLKKHGVGNYRLEFLAGSKVFYNFDFEYVVFGNIGNYMKPRPNGSGKSSEYRLLIFSNRKSSFLIGSHNKLCRESYIIGSR